VLEQVADLNPTSGVIASASEAIQTIAADAVWIASSLSLLTNDGPG
jgi:hypothetical protein